MNNSEVIGDMRPITTSPNFSGFLIKIFSTSQVKLKMKLRKIRMQYNAIKLTRRVTDELTNPDCSNLNFMKKRILKPMNTTADECGMGMYLMENEVNAILPENHPNKLIPVMIRIMNNSKSFLLM